jgi:hypothetical protein
VLNSPARTGGRLSGRSGGRVRDDNVRVETTVHLSKVSLGRDTSVIPVMINDDTPISHP